MWRYFDVFWASLVSASLVSPSYRWLRMYAVTGVACVCTRVHIRAHMRVHVHMYVHTCMHTCIQACNHTNIQTCIHAWLNGWFTNSLDLFTECYVLLLSSVWSLLSKERCQAQTTNIIGHTRLLAVLVWMGSVSFEEGERVVRERNWCSLWSDQFHPKETETSELRYRCLWTKHSSGENYMWEDKLSECQISGWNAVSADDLQGKCSCTRNVVHRHRYHWTWCRSVEGKQDKASKSIN